MPRLSLINMCIGFALVALSASAGAFVAVDLTQRFLDGVTTSRWLEVLLATSHGHTSLFGLLHICFGLTLPYSLLNRQIKIIQTVGLGFGAIAMGPMMMVRAFLGPTSSTEWNGLVIGGLLSCALLAIFAHVFGLCLKIVQRG